MWFKCLAYIYICFAKVIYIHRFICTIIIQWFTWFKSANNSINYIIIIYKSNSITDSDIYWSLIVNLLCRNAVYMVKMYFMNSNYHIIYSCSSIANIHWNHEVIIVWLKYCTWLRSSLLVIIASTIFHIQCIRTNTLWHITCDRRFILRAFS